MTKLSKVPIEHSRARVQTHADSLSGPVSNPLVLSPPHATLLDLASFPLLSTGKVHLKGDRHEMMSSFCYQRELRRVCPPSGRTGVGTRKTASVRAPGSWQPCLEHSGSPDGPRSVCRAAGFSLLRGGLGSSQIKSGSLSLSYTQENLRISYATHLPAPNIFLP